jgi:hypothetical protein
MELVGIVARDARVLAVRAAHLLADPLLRDHWLIW